MDMHDLHLTLMGESGLRKTHSEPEGETMGKDGLR